MIFRPFLAKLFQKVRKRVNLLFVSILFGIAVYYSSASLYKKRLPADIYSKKGTGETA
ncbi:hypothetical protein GCM10010969_07630 [Saccharibacillus kuerlensis]|uniref:Uncharacterized protein n=1 Tax=Saccharibacillus kuerlensis TaxID=459527 RepID=A0ABQ2KXL2_9BACL|nr:hypothetical protein GCM10010969_07630 [Saccharibacillus kuerlensis]